MAEKILNVAYWFDATAVKRHCRKAEDTVLRGSVPITFPQLSESEAPVALNISIQHLSEPKLPDKLLSWRRDSISYLRPINLHVGPEHPPPAFDFLSQGEPASAELLDGLFSLAPNISVRREEFPSRWMFSGHPKLDDIRLDGQRHQRLHPSRLLTAESFGALVREWKSTDEPRATLEAIHASERYVFVDDILHRRVPPPVWRLSSWHPSLVNGEDAASLVCGPYALSAPSYLWPVTLSDDFGRRVAAAHDSLSRRIAATVEFAVAPDEDGDLAAVGQLLLNSMRDHFSQAILHLSDDNLDRFKIVRSCYALSAPPPLPRCIEGFDCLADMLSDPAFDPSTRHRNPRRTLSSLVDHWRRLLHAADRPILSPLEEDALSALAS